MKKRTKVFAIIILAVLIVGITSICICINHHTQNNEPEITDYEKDMANIGNYYLERNDSKVKSSRMYGKYEFYDVTFSGRNNAYLFAGFVKNKSGKDIDYITFTIQFLNYEGKVAFEYDGIAGFDDGISIIHIETEEIIPLYYDYKIINIKEKYN